MKGKVLALLLTGCGLLLAELPALAHHAFAAVFDSKKPVKLMGTVTKIEWQNPHTWFYIDVKDEGGNVANWGMEMGSPNLLIRAGWNRNSLKAGHVVTITGFRSKLSPTNANARTVKLPDGRQVFAGSSFDIGPASEGQLER